jgi:hypothetical protein
MNDCTTLTAGHAATGRTLSPRVSFFLLASITVSFLAGSLAPTPLYPVYQAEWGFSRDHHRDPGSTRRSFTLLVQ